MCALSISGVIAASARSTGVTGRAVCAETPTDDESARNQTAGMTLSRLTVPTAYIVIKASLIFDEEEDLKLNIVACLADPGRHRDSRYERRPR